MKKGTTELNRTFSKEEIQMDKKHMKKCSSSLAIKEMQINTTLRFLLLELLPSRTPTTNVGEDVGEKGALIYCWWECKLVQLRKTIWRLLKNLNIDLPYDPVTPLLGST
jgi:hypothetical protein